jgi:hypothetical protein
MDDSLGRLPHVLNVVVPLVLFMAWIYLGLHILFARLIANPSSPVLWFFGVVTGPLTRPIRAVLDARTSERHVRLIAFGVYVGLWVIARVALAQLVGAQRT